MIKIAICDDEQRCIDDIKVLLEKHFPKALPFAVREYRSGEQFLKDMKDRPADIIFMDIELTDITGIDAISALKGADINPIVFFVTSHSTYIQEIFRLQSFQFLPKPIDENDFAKDIVRAANEYVRGHRKLEIKAGGIVKEIAVNDIRCIEVNRKEIKIHTAGEVLSHYGNIAFYENKLKGYPFAKPHKSYLVSLAHIAEIGGDSILLDGMTERVPLTRKFRQDFLRSFNKYVSGERL